MYTKESMEFLPNDLVFAIITFSVIKDINTLLMTARRYENILNDEPLLSHLQIRLNLSVIVLSFRELVGYHWDIINPVSRSLFHIKNLHFDRAAEIYKKAGINIWITLFTDGGKNENAIVDFLLCPKMITHIGCSNFLTPIFDLRAMENRIKVYEYCAQLFGCEYTIIKPALRIAIQLEDEKFVLYLLSKNGYVDIDASNTEMGIYHFLWYLELAKYNEYISNDEYDNIVGYGRLAIGDR